MKVSNFFINADKTLRFVPLLSTVTSGVDLTMQGLMKLNLLSHDRTHHPYRDYIASKKLGENLWGLVPVIGNAVLFVFYRNGDKSSAPDTRGDAQLARQLAANEDYSDDDQVAPDTSRDAEIARTLAAGSGIVSPFSEDEQTRLALAQSELDAALKASRLNQLLGSRTIKITDRSKIERGDDWMSEICSTLNSFSNSERFDPTETARALAEIISRILDDIEFFNAHNYQFQNGHNATRESLETFAQKIGAHIKTLPKSEEAAFLATFKLAQIYDNLLSESTNPTRAMTSDYIYSLRDEVQKLTPRLSAALPTASAAAPAPLVDPKPATPEEMRAARLAALEK